MAHHLAVGGALLMCLLALAHARMYETILNNEFEETNSRQTEAEREKCRIQLHRTLLTSCRNFLEPSMLRPSIEGQRPKQCCEDLKNVSQECRCHAIREIAEQVGYSQKEQQLMKEVRMKAQKLPKVCGVQPQYCQMNQDNEC